MSSLDCIRLLRAIVAQFLTKKYEKEIFEGINNIESDLMRLEHYDYVFNHLRRLLNEN